MQTLPGQTTADALPTAQVRASIERVSFRNDDNGWTVLRARLCDDEQTIITATGHFAAVQPGEHFEFFGSWSRHPQYGPQFKIERLVPVRPTTIAAMERYLTSGLIKGIGPKTAQRILKAFGTKTFDVLDQTPERLREVPKLNRKKVESLIVAWQEQRQVADVMRFLSAHGISPLFAARIFKHYGPEAIALLSANPYRLADDISGIGFLSADRIARSMGIAGDSRERLRAAILYLLQQAEEKGHCFVTSDQLIRMLVTTLEIDQARVAAMLEDCMDDLRGIGALVSEAHAELGVVHYRTELLLAETNVAAAIGKLLASPLLGVDTSRIDAWLERYSEASGTQLVEEQLDAVRKAATSRVFILTGGPGVGKTTTANTIIRLLKAMGRQVALGAPTGRAAQRLTEVAATPARTIHRLLEWQPHLHRFARNESNPLPVQTVIIDEASMLDIRLAEALISAVGATAQLILIGDVDQLPSVGPGNVLRDLIDCERVPYTRLTRIFRQAATSRIVRTAHAINHGNGAEAMAMFNEEVAGSDCQFLDVDNSEGIKSALEDLVTRRLPEDYGFDPVADVQILTPMNRGDLGTQALNEDLQRLLNPLRPGMAELKRGSLVLRPGDKVIQCVNNYDLGVFNGDIGRVRDVRVQGGKVLVEFGDDRMVAYEEDQILDLRLAYAITIHKSQGSEFPVVIIPSSMQHYVMLQRNLVYTGLTRARKLAFFVGARRALQYAIGNQVSANRQTGLVDRVCRAVQA